MNKEAMKPMECHTCKGLGRIYMGCGSWIHCDTCNTTGKATTPPKREPPCKTGSQCTTKCMECAEPTPVAVVSGYYGGKCVVLPTDPARIFNSGTAFYTHPPKREWQGLMDEEVYQIYEQVEKEVGDHWEAGGTTMMFPITLYQVIEAKLKEKNNG